MLRRPSPGEGGQEWPGIMPDMQGRVRVGDRPGIFLSGMHWEGQGPSPGSELGTLGIACVDIAESEGLAT